jgi:ABC-2 type transport system ATP-binding protein
MKGMAHAIEVSGLTKHFGPVVAVDDLTFTADEGRVVGFLGPNGAGKTTTLRMLLGLVNPTAGRATIQGEAYVHIADPVHTVGAVLDGGMLHPGRTGRNHLRARRSCSSSSRSRTPATAEPAATRSACASGSASRPRCSATRMS